MKRFTLFYIGILDRFSNRQDNGIDVIQATILMGLGVLVHLFGEFFFSMINKKFKKHVLISVTTMVASLLALEDNSVGKNLLDPIFALEKVFWGINMG